VLTGAEEVWLVRQGPELATLPATAHGKNNGIGLDAERATL
jgi:hypothetical protein